MKLLGVLSLCTVIFATLSAAQKVHIISAKPSEKVGLGNAVTVQIARPASEHPSTEVGLAISTISCTFSPCPPPTQAVGDVLYHGPYNPESSENGVAYQHFTVVLPNFQPFIGPAHTNVIRLALVGVHPGVAYRKFSPSEYHSSHSGHNLGSHRHSLKEGTAGKNTLLYT